jgi:hypothetical protein
MRALTENEISQIVGFGSVSYQLPAGASLTSTLMPNQSTTLSVQLASGQSYSWNSGTFLTCTVLGAGVGSAAFAFSGGNAAIGALGGFMASRACGIFIGVPNGQVNDAS